MRERPHVGDMLVEQSRMLDEIFGSDSCAIEKTSEYSATLKTELADFEFTDDPRDFVSASLVSLPGIEVPQSPLHIWMQFLGIETPIQQRNEPYKKQVMNELQCVAAVADRVLRDPAISCNAAWFVRGYNRAYNDWASGKGSWAEPDLEE